MSGARVLVLALSLAACGPEAPEGGPVPGPALPPPGGLVAPGDPAGPEVRGYLLTEGGLDRYFAASHAIVAAMAALPPEELARVAHALEPEEAGLGAASLDAFAARLAGDAVIRRGLEEAGVDAREYAVLTLALLEAGVAQQWIDAQPGADADALARRLGLDPRNVAFMRTHAAEIQERQVALEAEFPAALRGDLEAPP